MHNSYASVHKHNTTTSSVLSSYKPLSCQLWDSEQGFDKVLNKA